MSKRKILTIVGTRPEIIKLSRVIAELELHFDHVLAHTGQNYDYELNEIFFEELEIRRPDHFLQAAGDNYAQTIGNVISAADALIAEISPDALLILGDTNSCLSAIPAKRRKVPIFHMEAGNRCFDSRVPEEINRRIVDHISDINMPYTEHARRYLLAEGIRPDTVIKTGSPMREVLEHYGEQIDRSDVLDRMELTDGEYFVVSCHREENVDSPENFSDFLESLDAIARKWERPLIVSTHPRTRKRLGDLGDTGKPGELVRFLKPLGLVDYVCLQSRAACVISDSGTITEESSILNFPAVTIRQAHERPEGMDEGVLVMCGLKPGHVIGAIEMVTSQHHAGGAPRLVEDYDVECVSTKVARIIASYIGYVNRTVWYK